MKYINIERLSVVFFSVLLVIHFIVICSFIKDLLSGMFALIEPWDIVAIFILMHVYVFISIFLSREIIANCDNVRELNKIKEVQD